MNTFNHAFKDFDQSLRGLEDRLNVALERIQQLLNLGQQALGVMQDKVAVQALLKEGRKLDKEVNQLEFEITAMIQGIFSKYNPRGQDLRFVIGSIKVATHLESIADKAKNCLKRIFKTEGVFTDQTITRLQQMLGISGQIALHIQTLQESYDEEAAAAITRLRKEIEQGYRAIWADGKQVDANYHNSVMLAKNIERIADVAVDLKKILYFIHTGEKHRKKKPVTQA